MFYFVGPLSAIRELIFRHFAEQEKNRQNTTSNAAIREISVKTRKKKLTTTLNAARLSLKFENVVPEGWT